MIAFFYGPDTYRSKQKIRDLKREFIKKKDKSGLNVFLFQSPNFEINELRKAILSQGFLTEKRMIIINNLLTVSNVKTQKILKEIIRIIKLENKKEKDNARHKNNVIVFWDEQINDKSLKLEQKELFQILKKEKYCEEFKLLTPVLLKQWIKKRFIKSQMNINIQVIDFLTTQSNNLWFLENEIEKIISLKQSQKNKNLSLNDLKDFFPPKLEDNIWKLIDALGEKNKRRGLKILSDLIKQNIDFSEIISLLAHQYRTILRVKSYLQENGNFNNYQLGKSLSLHPFVCQKALIQENKYNLKQLKKTYQQLLKIDFLRKTKKIDPQTLLDLLIIKS